MKDEKRLFILDANALLHRAWHAIPPFTSPEGKVVNAIYGMLSVVMKTVKDFHPDAMVACWDTAAATFRHEAFEEYKAQREKQADELYAQIPMAKEGLALFGIDSYSLDGFEADDLIGTFAIRAKKAGWDVTIVTGDRDTFQLIQPNISVLTFKKGVSDTVLYDEAELKKQYGLLPTQFVDYKVMRGDPSDNIPGIKGIGEKGATDLLTRFGSLENIVKAAHDKTSDLSPSLRAKLLEGENGIPALLDLVRLKLDVPIEWKPEKATGFPKDVDAFQTFLMRMGFKSLLARLGTNIPREEKEVLPTKAKKTSEKSASVHAEEGVTLASAKDGFAAIETLRASGKIFVQVMRGQAGSLFSQSVEGLLLATEKEAYLFQNSFLEKQPGVKKELSALLKDEAIAKMAHDAKSEMKALLSLGLEISGWTFDTMLAAYLLSAGDRTYDLAPLALRHGLPLLKEEDSAFTRARVAWELIPLLQKEMEEQKLLPIFEQFELPLIPVLFNMEQVGIKIDVPYLRELSKELQEKKETLEKKMEELVGRPFNPASPQQLATILFEELKLPSKGVHRGKTGLSTAAPELEKLRGAHPIIELIEDHRELAKLLSTYVDSLPLLADTHGRVHTTFNQAITATGRLSSSDPNLQNIPIRSELGREIRRAFIAQEGCMLVSCDYSQIELRVVASMAKDKEMTDAFVRGEDIHRATAAAIWHVKEKDVTPDQRRIAKAINFGIIFGQGPQGLSQVADIPFQEAKKFIEEYFKVYQGIKSYMEETKVIAHANGYVETLFGRRRYLPEIESNMPQVRSQAERMAINMPIQGTDADLMKLAMIKVAHELPSVCKEAKMLLQVHDELVFEMPEACVKEASAWIKKTMETVQQIGVPIVVEVKVGKNWAEMEKQK
jgi:DNA polymerase-1